MFNAHAHAHPIAAALPAPAAGALSAAVKGQARAHDDSAPGKACGGELRQPCGTVAPGNAPVSAHRRARFDSQRVPSGPGCRPRALR